MGNVYTTKVTSKGQVTIPAEIRKQMGLRPGDTLVVRESPAGCILQKHVEVSPFDRYVGCLGDKAHVGTDTLMREMRGADD